MFEGGSPDVTEGVSVGSGVDVFEGGNPDVIEGDGVGSGVGGKQISKHSCCVAY